MAKKKKANLKSDEYPDWLDHEIWQEFIQFRAEIGKPIYEIGEKRMLKKLERLSVDCKYQDILDRSIRNNWQDIYALPEQDRTDQTIRNDDNVFKPNDHLH